MELLIGVGIFTLAATLTFGSYSVVNKHWRASSVKEQAISELRLALDLLTTELAFGSAFPTTCADGCDSFLFATQVRPDMPLKTVQYQLDDTATRIVRAEMKTSGVCSSLPFADECFVPLTSARSTVESFHFFVENFEEDRHPLITVTMSGVLMPGTNLAEPFSISTSATPRAGVVVGAKPPVDIAAPTVVITDPTSDDTYATAAAIVSLSGTARDNVGVVAMEVLNEQTGSGGLVTMTTSDGGLNVTWQTSAIPLMPGVDNKITVRARDAEDNVGADTLIVQSTGELEAPSLTSVTFECMGGFSPFMKVIWTEVAGASSYLLEHCRGEECTNFEDFQVIESAGTAYFSSVSAGEFYRYRVRAYNPSLSNQYSEYSNIEGALADPACQGPAPAPIPGPPFDGGGSGPPDGSSPPAQGFELEASPSVIEVTVNGSSRNSFRSTPTDITVKPYGGFNDPVTLSVMSVSPPVPGFTARWQPHDALLEEREYERGAAFRARVRGDTPPLDGSTYQIVISGSGGGWSDTVTVYLRVQGTEGFEE